jgi:hypothetical protein
MVTETKKELELVNPAVIYDVDDLIYGDEPAYVSER